jgi:hypothetical protein
MSKKISPVFAAIVIIVALVIGGLYFMTRYRNAEAKFAAESAALQQQADRARSSGRMARGQARRGSRRAPEGAPTSPAPGRAAPGAPPEGE